MVSKLLRLVLAIISHVGTTQHTKCCFHCILKLGWHCSCLACLRCIHALDINFGFWWLWGMVWLICNYCVISRHKYNLKQHGYTKSWKVCFLSKMRLLKQIATCENDIVERTDLLSSYWKCKKKILTDVSSWHYHKIFYICSYHNSRWLHWSL